jgi:hypothetical protein
MPQPTTLLRAPAKMNTNSKSHFETFNVNLKLIYSNLAQERNDGNKSELTTLTI